MIQLEPQPELEARITADAQRHGLSVEQYVAEATGYFIAEDDPSQSCDATAGIEQGVRELEQGLGRPASEFLDEMRGKYAIPR